MDYSPEVLRRFASPCGVQEFVDGRDGLVEGEAEDRSLNVWVRFQVQLADERIHTVRFQVFGCPHAVAAADWIAERLAGQPVASLTRVDIQEVARALSIPLEKMGKLLRIEDALAECARRLEAAEEQ